MKELTIEEKAKRYGEALERAKKLQETCDSTAVVGWCEYIFPELKESEDERIRKELIEQVAYIIPNDDEVDSEGNALSTYQKRIDKYRAWLEKQGKQEPYGKRKECEDCQFNYAGECKGYCQMKRDEQKPVDNVKPKFNEGDWICNDMCIVRIESIKNGMYYFYEGDGLSIAFVDKHYHLWTIRDAKDGDVLISSNKQPFVYNGNYTSVRLGAYFGLTTTGGLLICDSHGNNWTDLTGVQPATEEERNALFKKLHDSDYKWDGEKKELWHKYL